MAARSQSVRIDPAAQRDRTPPGKRQLPVRGAIPLPRQSGRALAIACCCLLLVPLSGEAGDQAECALEEGTPAFEHLEAGRVLLGNGDLARAEAELEEANRLTGGTCYEPLVALARVRLELGLYEAASEAAVRAEEVAPSVRLDATATALEGAILLAKAEAQAPEEEERATALLLEAQSLLRRALIFESSVPEDTRYLLARTLDLQGELREAWQQYRGYLDRHPDARRAARARARVEEIQEQFEAAGEPLELPQGVAPPKVIRRVRPEYPRRMIGEGIEGRVVLQGVIDTKGRFRRVRVVKSLHPLFDESAFEAVSKWKFEPARRLETGEPVAVPYTLTVQFEPR